MRFRRDRHGKFVQTYAQGGIVQPAQNYDHIPVILSEGEHWTPEEAKRYFGTETLKKINERRPAMRKSFWDRMRAAIPCTHCWGRGYVREKGRRLLSAELTPSQRAQELAEGVRYYREVVKTCPKCGGKG